ncbi:MAG: hypothetical protein U1F41_05290 [Burkholderiales bacterium]
MRLARFAPLLLLAHALPAFAADTALAAPICDTLKKLLPEVKTFKPEGARAQLVMALAEKFEYDGARLRRVKSDIDQVTTASCPKEREAMLSILKMKSLSEAVS